MDNPERYLNNQNKIKSDLIYKEYDKCLEISHQSKNNDFTCCDVIYKEYLRHLDLSIKEGNLLSVKNQTHIQ